jgi:hypothetical protein
VGLVVYAAGRFVFSGWATTGVRFLASLLALVLLHLGLLLLLDRRGIRDALSLLPKEAVL